MFWEGFLADIRHFQVVFTGEISIWSENDSLMSTQQAPFVQHDIFWTKS